jgi:hypothetical protein
MRTQLTTAAALLVLVGCKAMYSPNMASTPLFTKQGELRAGADPRNLQVAYAATSHLGVMTNGYFRSQDEELDSGERQVGKGWLLEAAVGAFMTLEEPSWMQVEMYGGVGVGNVKQEITPMGGTTRTFEAEGYRAFIMPTAGFTGKYVEAAFSARLAAVNYTSSTATNYSQMDLENDKLTELEKNTWLFLEPALTVRGGYKWVKLQVQLGQSYKLSSADMNREKGMFSISLNVDLFRSFD